MKQFEVDEGQRQLLLLALANLALLRPGFLYALGEVAEVLDGRPMFDEFRRVNGEAVKPTPFPGEVALANAET